MHGERSGRTDAHGAMHGERSGRPPSRLELVLLVSLCAAAVASPAAAIAAPDADADLADELASFIVEPSPAIEALKRSIDGAYTYDRLETVEPFFDTTIGNWGVVETARPLDLPFLAYFQTLDGVAFVLRTVIDRAAFEANGTVALATLSAEDGNADVPVSSESLCIWSPGSSSDTLFLRCANTHGPALLTFYHITGISGGAISQMQGHSIEPADVRAQYLADGEVRDAGAFLSFFTKVA